MVVAVAVAVAVGWEGGGEGCGGREGEGEETNYPVKLSTRSPGLDKFANFAGKAKPLGYLVTIPR